MPNCNANFYIYFFLFVDIRQKKIIDNFYKNLMLEQQNIDESHKMKYKDVIKTVLKTSGIGQKTVEHTLSEYKNKAKSSQFLVQT